MENKEDKFVIEGNPGQGNTFVKIGHVENYNPNAATVTTTITTNHYYGREEGGGASSRPGDKRLGSMSYRDMLKAGYIDTGNIRKLIMGYVSRILTFVKTDSKDLFLRLWARILDHEAFRTGLYDPGKQDCKFNRYLVACILHYLDGKGFYAVPYSQSDMTRAVEGDADSPVRKGFRGYPGQDICRVIDGLLKDLEA